MKKINNYSAQYNIISEQFHNQNYGKNTAKPKSFTHKKTLSKDRQEFINNISASGYKPFHA